jgi:hypothetical protein
VGDRARRVDALVTVLPRYGQVRVDDRGDAVVSDPFASMLASLAVVRTQWVLGWTTGL